MLFCSARREPSIIPSQLPIGRKACEALLVVGRGGYAYNVTFALGTDLEKVRLINAAVCQIPPETLARSPVPLRDVGLTVITPSVALEELALQHVAELPRALRMLLASVGGTGEGGAGLLSYLLFEPGYCRALIRLGYADAQVKKDEIDALLAGAF